MKYTELSSRTKNIICRFLGVIPDKTFLKILYRIKTGRKLHLKNPVTYSEKLNWLKVYDKNPLYTQLVDKYEVRRYVSQRIGEQYLFPLLGVWDRFEDILKRAKAMCDYLIVGVSTDEVVQEYKHKNPVIPFEDRLAIVEAIKYVDKAIPQVTMDKMVAYKKIHFDALFHGSDWQDSAMYDEIEKSFSAIGVDVVFLPHTDGISSSLIRDKSDKAVD